MIAEGPWLVQLAPLTSGLPGKGVDVTPGSLESVVKGNTSFQQLQL